LGRLADPECIEAWTWQPGVASRSTYVAESGSRPFAALSESSWVVGDSGSSQDDSVIQRCDLIALCAVRDRREAASRGAIRRLLKPGRAERTVSRRSRAEVATRVRRPVGCHGLVPQYGMPRQAAARLLSGTRSQTGPSTVGEPLLNWPPGVGACAVGDLTWLR
jgi:hypothetical protein